MPSVRLPPRLRKELREINCHLKVEKRMWKNHQRDSFSQETRPALHRFLRRATVQELQTHEIVQALLRGQTSHRAACNKPSQTTKCGNLQVPEGHVVLEASTGRNNPRAPTAHQGVCTASFSLLQLRLHGHNHLLLLHLLLLARAGPPCEGRSVRVLCARRGTNGLLFNFQAAVE